MESIDLYSTHCPKCIMLEQKLKIAGICYNLITNFDLKEIRAKGILSMPVLKVNDNWLTYEEALEWLKKGKL